MIVVDVEGTGVNTDKHSIISIGAIEFENPNNQMYVEMQPWEGAEIMDEAMDVNGFSREEIKSFPNTFNTGIKIFDAWLKNVNEHTLAGQNVGAYDLPFIQDSYFRVGMNFSLPHRTIDVHTLAYMHLVKKGKIPPVKKNRTAINSSFIQDYVGIPEEPKPHNALTGAKVSAEAISRLLYGRNLLPEFKDFPVPENLL